MSLRLKAASLVAVMVTAVASLFATDPSLASGTAETSESIAVSSRALATADGFPAVPAASQDPVSIVHNADGSVTVTPRVPADASPDLPSAATSLAELVDEQVVPASLDSEMQCLAGTVYFESKGETLAGQLAVARVVINRVRSGKFADNMCGVVHQPGQFSFIRGGRMPDINTSRPSWRRAVAIAQIAMADTWDSAAEGALFFHARRVSPGWKRTRLAAIDNHIFYR